MVALQRIHRRDQRWIARGGGPLQSERGRDDGDRRARAFDGDATGGGNPCHGRHRFCLSRNEIAQARNPSGSGVGHAKSREHIEIRRERSDRSRAVISDVRFDQGGRGEAANRWTATAATAAAVATTTKTSPKFSAEAA